MTRVTIVSGDGHIGNTLEGYREYLDPQYRDLIDELMLTEGAMYRTGAEFARKRALDIDVVGDRGQGSSSQVRELYLDIDKRLAEMDADGIVAEVTVMGSIDVGPTPFFAEFNRSFPPEVRAAGVAAHHRWLVDAGAQADGRLILVGESGPCHDMAQSVAELEWIADHGFVAVSLPGLVADPDLPPLTSEHFEPFWAACEDLGLVVYIHAGWGERQGKILEFMERVMSGELEVHELMDGANPESPFALNMTPRRPLWQLMLSGVFDRHPNLKVGLIELRSDWIPGTLAFLDQRFEADAPRLALKPSEYWRRNCFVAPSAPRLVEIEQRHDLGVDNLLFGTDFPHVEGTWPNTRQWIQAAFQGVPETEARKILGENAMRVFGLDGAKLDAIAAKIGPTPAELFADVDVDQRLLEAFDRRNGMLHPVEEIDIDKVEVLLADDIAMTANR